MKVYFYEELNEKTVNELLDLLSNYVKLRDDIYGIMKTDPEMKDFYIENYLYFYLLNIAKIKTTLETKV